ncbi:MAG: CehA/McbA family metallohydrolase [Planctomycetaceae bacterium]|nr:CehA/McbA family metallohydrolase [Planctomycetaceae bacterium]
MNTLQKAAALGLACSVLLPLKIAGETVLSGAVVDDQTGRPVPCRLTLTGSDGKAWFVRSSDPTGSAVVYDKTRSPRSVERHTTLSAHPFVAELPPGEYLLRAERGKEYLPVESVVTLGDEPHSVELRLKRWTDMAARGWYSGDTHVHRSLDELPNVMLAEDLNVALPLSYWVRTAYTAPEQDPLSAAVDAKLTAVDATHVIWPVNTEYEIFSVNGQNHTLGAVFVLNHRQSLVPGAPPVTPIAKLAREQGAILDLDKHSWPWSLMLVPVMDVDLFELTNNHVWETEFYFTRWTTGVQPEGWEIETNEHGWTEWGWIDFGFKTYYALLNSGFRLRPTAGTASGVHPVPLGFGRVYVHVPGEFAFDKWMDGLNAGRSFVTTGPLLVCEFNGGDPGQTIVARGPTRLKIRGTAESVRPLAAIELILNGDVVREIPVQNQRSEAGVYTTTIDDEITLESSGWVAVRCFEEHPSRRNRFAHTGPVHVDITGRPLLPRLHEVRYFVSRMEQELERNRGVLKAEELAEYEQALAVYRELLQRTDGE